MIRIVIQNYVNPDLQTSFCFIILSELYCISYCCFMCIYIVHVLTCCTLLHANSYALVVPCSLCLHVQLHVAWVGG